MNIFNTPLSENSQSCYIRDKVELERKIKRYRNHVKVSEWCYHFNRVFISPGNSFNVKYIIKFLSSTLAKPNGTSITRVPATASSYNNCIIPQKVTGSQSSTTLNNIEVAKDDGELVVNKDVYVFDILDRLSSEEFLELLDIEQENILETLQSQYRMFNDILDNESMSDLEKLNNEILTEVPYKIYIEAVEHNNIPPKIKYEQNHIVNKVKKDDILGVLKTCGVIIIDISRDIAALARGKEIFRSFKTEIANVKGKKNTNAMKNKRLIVLLSTVMTWAGANNKYTVNKNYNVKNREPNPAFVEHYEFELEVLAVNQTIGLKEMMSTVIIWTGFTYGYEQDLLRFAFNSACRNTDLFPIPNSQNYIPVIHIQNLARVIHNVISENKQLLKYNNCIFAVESPINTLQKIITDLGKTCDIRTASSVSLGTFINNYKLKGLHKEMMSVDIKVNWNMKQVWPNFEWYGGKSSITHNMKSLVEIYKREHNIKILKLHIIGPAAYEETVLAHRIAQYYNLIYLDPKQITQKLVDSIKEEIISLRQKINNIKSEIDILDNHDNKDTLEEDNIILTERILSEKREKLYASMDFNDGVLEDEYLIPLLNEEISRLTFTKRGYVLVGYPNTIRQAEEIFNNINSLQQIDVNKLPDLVVFVKQNTQSGLAHPNDTSQLETNITKKKIKFSELDVVNSKNDLVQSVSTGVTAKSILNKSTKNYNINQDPKKSNNWNAENYDKLLKMFGRYYVPIKTIDSSMPSFGLNTNELIKTNPDIEPILNNLIKEIELNQLHELFKDNTISLDKTDSMYKEKDIARAPFEDLNKKMILIEEFQNLLDFENIRNLSREEYLMKYVSLQLSKLVVQVAKLKPKNAVGFLAYVALKDNPESLLHCPGYYQESVKIQKLMKFMYNIFDPDNVIYPKSLVEMSMVHSSSDENVKENEEESVGEENYFENYIK